MNQTYTIDEWSRHWLAEQTEKELHPKSISSYRNAVERHIAPTFCGTMLGDLSASHIRQAYSQWKKDGMSSNTVRAIHLVLSRCLEEACVQELLKANPARLCRMEPVTANRSKLPTERQCYNYIKIARQQREYPMLYLALSVGLPQRELRTLRWTDFSISRRQIIVGSHLYSVNEKCVELLTVQYAKIGESPWMFPHPRTGQPYKSTQFHYIHTKVLRLAKLPSIPFGKLQKKCREVGI